MATNTSLIAEFDHEMGTTRKLLERLPDGKFEWQPHDRSMTLGRLARHIAELPHWVGVTIHQDELDVSPPGGPPYQPSSAATREEVLASFDKNVIDGRAALAEANDPEFRKPWRLLNGGVTVFTMPKKAVLRSFVMNHLIHHRGQLSVYLRLNDIPIPSIYGPSADEGQM